MFTVQLELVQQQLKVVCRFLHFSHHANEQDSSLPCIRSISPRNTLLLRSSFSLLWILIRRRTGLAIWSFECCTRLKLRDIGREREKILFPLNAMVNKKTLFSDQPDQCFFPYTPHSESRLEQKKKAFFCSSRSLVSKVTSSDVKNLDSLW